MEPALAGDRATDLVGGKPPPISECDIYGRASPTALPKGKPKTIISAIFAMFALKFAEMP